jgi:hypothetical protein
VPILSDCTGYKRLLILVWPQLGDFDSLEYAWWLEKEATLWQNAGITIRVTIVLDNARYQKCKIVEESALSLSIELLYLPSYSPNLNLIERRWKLVKKKCLYGKYFC